ncbi:MAG: prolipoprotein diacylglyceryl transferase [Planctomycetota bacterium]
MSFPVWIDLGVLRLHPHVVLETLAFVLGFQSWRILRRRWPGTDAAARAETSATWSVLIGAIGGALLGSKLLGWLEWAPELWPQRDNPATWVAGTTIVGALLGGWAGVELAKRRAGIASSTGDQMVFPLSLAIVVGRVGCFLTGPEDRTTGVHTTLPWAIDFGDGPRHPTPLYEIAFVLLAALVLWRWWRRRPRWPGQLFRVWLLAYLAWRLAVDFIKPHPVIVLGMGAIQLACVGGVLLCIWRLRADAPGRLLHG